MTSETEDSGEAAKGLEGPRLIERAFPLKQASLDSVHEKNVRHGHISTLHIWPARRPLAACRAALIATLLPDPGTPEKRKDILERLAGKIVQVPRKKKLPNGQVKVEHKDETVGGILHWGRESGPDLEWFREEIRKAYGGRAPRVLDPFAGGGAIPLEAMRLGCEVTASDINPVAWFILRCTLEYPQRLAGQKRPLPKFALESPEFIREYWKKTGKYSKKQLDQKVAQLQAKKPTTRQTGLLKPGEGRGIEAGLAWHVRAWGHWVLEHARKDLEKFYPRVDGKRTVAYLWARTVTCKNCRATIPLLKTRWLCKKEKKRVLLRMELNEERREVTFGVEVDVPVEGRNSAQRRERDKHIGSGTMSKSGASCPFCKAIVTMADIRIAARSGALGTRMTAVVVGGQTGKSYREPAPEDVRESENARSQLDNAFSDIPFGSPSEATPSPSGPRQTGSSLPLYGLTEWRHVFHPRQLLSMASFVKHTRACIEELRRQGCPQDWAEGIVASLADVIDKLADYNSSLCTWHVTGEKMSHVFVRFALPVNWDFAELNPFSGASGDYDGCLDWVARVIEHTTTATIAAPPPVVIKRSAIEGLADCTVDLVLTDPPYYDAIPYSDLMDFFYVWLRRSLYGVSPAYDSAFSEPLGPKWNHQANDGELVDDPSRFADDKSKSKLVYEDGMFRAFAASHRCLTPQGRMVVVFANKKPDAWETLVSAIIRAGYVVDGSWPIQTEMGNRTRAQSSAALSSSVWLVCRKRTESAPPGWDNQVLEEMGSKIHERLREYWDAGIRGPDFVWAATGPALEAYSKHPIVKKANEPGAVMTVSEFLRHVRRIVVDFVVGRVLSKDGDGTSASGLDDLTTYYLLHRYDFGFDDAPAGACILYAVSCGLSDTALSGEYDLLVRTGGIQQEENEEESDEEEGEIEEGSGSTMRLKRWDHRRGKNLGLDVGARPTPLIDRIHHLLQLWRSGDVTRVDGYLEEHGLKRNAIFHQVLQALIELSEAGSEERSLLESISNHVSAKGGTVKKPKTILEYTDSDSGGGKPK
jgi:adenine-specific DNA methylase